MTIGVLAVPATPCSSITGVPPELLDHLTLAVESSMGIRDRVGTLVRPAEHWGGRIGDSGAMTRALVIVSDVGLTLPVRE